MQHRQHTREGEGHDTNQRRTKWPAVLYTKHGSAPSHRPTADEGEKRWEVHVTDGRESDVVREEKTKKSTDRWPDH